MIGLIENQRILVLGFRYRPSCDQLACRQVDYSNFIRAPKIDIKLCTSMVNSHSLGLGARKRDVPDEFETLRIDNAKHMCLRVWSLASACHVVVFVYRIVYTSIHVGRQLYFVEDLVGATAYQFDRSGFFISFGHDQRIGAGEILDGVWLSKAGNCMNPSTRADVKNLDSLVILCDKEQAVTLDVSRKMFEIANISWQQYGLYQS